MSSLRPVTRSIRTWVRPQRQGAIFKVVDIPCAIADQREGLFRDGCEDQFSLFTVRQDGACLGIDNLGEEVILEDMHAAPALGAFHGDPRSHDFRQAIDIQGHDIHGAFYFVPHFIGPWLSPEDPDPQLKVPHCRRPWLVPVLPG